MGDAQVSLEQPRPSPHHRWVLAVAWQRVWFHSLMSMSSVNAGLLGYRRTPFTPDFSYRTWSSDPIRKYRTWSSDPIRN
uniref:Uncharacterized protein n=1 Tax=Anguilla anguilla TaxID=7936 RepID=A0A0E9SKJ0_ANGAN